MGLGVGDRGSGFGVSGAEASRRSACGTDFKAVISFRRWRTSDCFWVSGLTLFSFRLLPINPKPETAQGPFHLRWLELQASDARD